MTPSQPPWVVLRVVPRGTPIRSRARDSRQERTTGPENERHKTFSSACWRLKVVIGLLWNSEFSNRATESFEGDTDETFRSCSRWGHRFR